MGYPYVRFICNGGQADEAARATGDESVLTIRGLGRTIEMGDAAWGYGIVPQ